MARPVTPDDIEIDALDRGRSVAGNVGCELPCIDWPAGFEYMDGRKSAERLVDVDDDGRLQAAKRATQGAGLSGQQPGCNDIDEVDQAVIKSTVAVR
jgi:hypothetical protein